jgi:hypothetical protein
MNRKLLVVLPLISLVAACSVFNKNKSNMANKVVYLDTLEMPISAQKIHPYKPERTKKFSLVHTKLDVRFDWEKQYLYGKAWLRVHPHFYAQNVLETRCQRL